MSINTYITRSYDLSYPVILAPMGGVSGGRLAAAVSNAGGLGMVGGGYGDIKWLKRELNIVTAETDRSWGVGFITWCLSHEALETALRYEPSAIMLSFGNPQPWAKRIKKAGIQLICQVQDLKSARLAKEAGADILVAQGTEAGGHGGTRSTLPLVPAIIDAIENIPVIAAGGVADGRALAASLMLGASGVLMGTRFYATHESLAHPSVKKRLISGEGDATIRTQVFDIVRGYDWPVPYTGRALTNDFLESWHGRENELLGSIDAEAKTFKKALMAADTDIMMVWSGECIDLIRELGDAADIVSSIGKQAEDLLNSGPALVNSAN